MEEENSGKSGAVTFAAVRHLKIPAKDHFSLPVSGSGEQAKPFPEYQGNTPNGCAYKHKTKLKQ